MKIPKVAIEIEGNIVRVELIFRDRYEAVVYHDDVVELLGSGRGATLSFKCPAQNPVVERR